MSYQIGVGKWDITGPCVQVGFMGMSNIGQQGEGIQTRLFARAFVVVDDHGARVAIVVVDLAACSQAVKLEVVRRLGADPDFKENGQPLYTDENLMITATHTHGGPGGYSHYFMYNASISGFCHQNFECIVSGIVESLRQAHGSLGPGRILWTRGRILEDFGGNRSREAYKLNPDLGSDEVDREMVLLKFTSADGDPRGMLNWFPAHTTTMGEKTCLVSGDHKGVASILFEKKHGGIIGAFANANCGDQSPNVKYNFPPDGVHDFEHCREIGKIQFDAADQLFETAATELSGSISFRQSYIDMSSYSLQDPPRRTWPAALGYGMLNGSEQDSRGLNSKKWGEGTTKENFEKDENLLLELLQHVVAPIVGVRWPKEKDLPPGYVEGHADKPIVFHVGLARCRGISLAPSILPVQMFKIGPLVVVGHPGEITTVAGRRLRNAVQDIFGPAHADPIVLAAYSNAFSSYTTTREEYAGQHYEGASTLFGPWTFDAYLHEHKKLARAIRDGQPAGPGPLPPVIPDEKVIPGAGKRKLPDGRILGRSLKIGDIDGDARQGYKRGELVSVTFLGGYPGNNLRTNESYLTVERKTTGGFVPVYTDHDLSTSFRWQGHGLASKIIIKWEIPSDEAPGTYRIRYFGDYWESFPKDLHPIVSASREFKVD